MAKYSMFRPQMVRRIPVQNFYIVTRKGAVGAGEFTMPAWHKLEKENILKAVGLKIEYGEPVETGEYRGKRGTTIGDKEHSEIIEMYIGGLSMNKINKQKGRSTKSIKDHIDAHNQSVERSGFCPACRRVHSQNQGKLAFYTQKHC